MIPLLEWGWDHLFVFIDASQLVSSSCPESLLTLHTDPPLLAISLPLGGHRVPSAMNGPFVERAALLDRALHIRSCSMTLQMRREAPVHKSTSFLRRPTDERCAPYDLTRPVDPTHTHARRHGARHCVIASLCLHWLVGTLVEVVSLTIDHARTRAQSISDRSIYLTSFHPSRVCQPVSR